MKYSGVNGIAVYESEIRIHKYKMTDPIWWSKSSKIGIRMILGSRALENPKFKIADPIWRMRMQIFIKLGRYLVLDGFWGRCIRI